MDVRLVLRIFGYSDPRFAVCAPDPDPCDSQKKKGSSQIGVGNLDTGKQVDEGERTKKPPLR